MKFFSIKSAMLFVLAVVASSAFANPTDIFAGKAKRSVGVIGRNRNAAVLAADAGKSLGINGRHRLPRTTAGADSSLECYSYGFLDGVDGNTWTYTMDTDGDMYYITGTTVTVYDATRTPIGSFRVDVPDSIRVNMVEPFGLVTTKLFDKNASTKEVVVYLHEVTPDYVGKDYLYVYTIGGGKIAEFEGDGMVVDASPNEWTTYQRLILARKGGNQKDYIEIYRSPSWGEDGAVLEHSFEFNSQLLTYTDGSIVSFSNLDGQPYYSICHYKNPFVLYDEDGNQMLDPDTWMPIFTSDNMFVIETYDRNFNKVNEVEIPCEARSEDYVARLVSFGVFSDKDLSRGYFTGDGKFNYIIMNEDVEVTSEYVTSFDVYNEDGIKVQTIADMVGDNYKRLSDIKGCEEQWVFLSSGNTGIYGVNLPSGETFSIPEVIGDYGVSFNIDRVPAKNEAGYEYIMGINEAATDETGTNVIAQFARFNAEFENVRYIRINLGPLAQTFTPLVSNEGLNPYLFNTDDKHEFLFFSKVRKGAETTEGRNVLFVADEDGNIIRTFGGEAEDYKGDIWSATILNFGKKNPMLFVNFYDWDNDRNTLDYYDLPLVRFAKGGDGTAANPYLISSAGDLAQITSAPGANYRLANSFNAYGYPVAVESFSGTLDGAGYTIDNLDVTSSNYYAGLFGNTESATIRNLCLANPVANIETGNQSFGLITGNAVDTHIDSVFVSVLNIHDDQPECTPIGGLVGLAAGATTISDCYMSAAMLIPNGYTIGGIAGELRTGSTVERCVLHNSIISGKTYVGGLVGVVGTGAVVADCSSSTNSVIAERFVGGIAGSCGTNGNSGSILRCLVSNGSVVANTRKGVGGIAGCMEPMWQQKTDTVYLQGCVAIQQCILVPETVGEEPSVHRIAGHTITDENPERQERNLVDNYVVFDARYAPEPLSGYTYYNIESMDPRSVEGSDLMESSLSDRGFWTSLGYNIPMPWVLEDEYPHLYLEDGNIPSAIRSLLASKQEAGAATATGIYNLSGQRVSVPSAGIYIVNGKKMLIK